MKIQRLLIVLTAVNLAILLRLELISEDSGDFGTA
jgi:hypothetical protein